MKTMKRMTGMALLLVVLTAAPVFGESGNDYDGLLYGLDFHDLTSTFHMGIALGDWEAGLKVDLPMEYDQPGIYIREIMEEICDPESESYNQDACDFLGELLTDEVIDALNAEWNRYIDDVFAHLPETALTRQFGWPFNGLGNVTLDDNAWSWPAGWNPESGEFVLPPLVFPHAFAAGPGGFWVLASGSMATGRIDASADFEMNGEYVFLTDFVLGTRGFLLIIGFGHGGPFTGTVL